MINRIFVIVALMATTMIYTYYQKYSLESQLVQGAANEAVLGHMPEVVFETLDGKPFPISSESATLFIVHYWGTWCAPCEAELPELLAFIKRFEGRSDVKFYLVAVNDEPLKIKKHLARLGLPKASLVWLIDNKNIHRDLFGTTRVPETFVFSSDKSTLRKYVGPQEWNKTMFFQTFDEFIQISSRKL